MARHGNNHSTHRTAHGSAELPNADLGIVEEETSNMGGGPVHFLKELKGNHIGVSKAIPVKVDLDSDLRGKVERFQFASPKMNRNLSNNQHTSSKERQQHAQKYSHFVNDLNNNRS